jgi:hypothetical protein
MAVAASVLALISAASYWYFTPRQGVRVEESLAGKAGEGTFGRFGQNCIRLAAGDLAAETTRTRLATQLRQESAYHVDLAVQDSGHAVERLTAALRKSGVKILMPAGTQNSLKQKQGKIRYFLFAENLRPEDVASILQQLGSSSRNKLDAGVHQVVIDVMTPEHRQQLVDLLGKRPSDPPADLVNRTIIAGKREGQATQPPSPIAAPPAQERFALVLAMPQGSLTSPADSVELRTFLGNRRAQHPDAVQVLLVVHDASV